MYVTAINTTTVDHFRAMDFVDVLTPNDGFYGGEFASNNQESVSRANKIHQRGDTIPASSGIIQRTNSSSNLRLLAQPPSQSIPNEYVYDSRAGNGTIVYVLDTGFNLKHVVRRIDFLSDNLN
jgi:hypothetical protein